MNETQWTRKMCRQLERDHACWVVPLVGNVRQMNGLPDRLICHHSWGTCWAEFKGVHTRLRDVQRLLLRRARAAGQFVVVIRQPDKVENEDGELLCEFDGTASDLFECLTRLSES